MSNIEIKKDSIKLKVGEKIAELKAFNIKSIKVVLSEKLLEKADSEDPLIKIDAVVKLIELALSRTEKLTAEEIEESLNVKDIPDFVQAIMSLNEFTSVQNEGEVISEEGKA